MKFVCDVSELNKAFGVLRVTKSPVVDRRVLVEATGGLVHARSYGMGVYAQHTIDANVIDEGHIICGPMDQLGHMSGTATVRAGHRVHVRADSKFSVNAFDGAYELFDMPDMCDVEFVGCGDLSKVMYLCDPNVITYGWVGEGFAVNLSAGAIRMAVAKTQYEGEFVSYPASLPAHGVEIGISEERVWAKKNGLIITTTTLAIPAPTPHLSALIGMYMKCMSETTAFCRVNKSDMENALKIAQATAGQSHAAVVEFRDGAMKIKLLNCTDGDAESKIECSGNGSFLSTIITGQALGALNMCGRDITIHGMDTAFVISDEKACHFSSLVKGADCYAKAT